MLTTININKTECKMDLKFIQLFVKNAWNVVYGSNVAASSFSQWTFHLKDCYAVCWENTFPYCGHQKARSPLKWKMQLNCKIWSFQVVLRPKKHLNFVESASIQWIPASTCWNTMNAVLLFCNLTSSSKRTSIQSWMQVDRLGKHGNSSVMGWSWLPFHGFYCAKLLLYYSACNGLDHLVVLSKNTWKKDQQHLHSHHGQLGNKQWSSKKKIFQWVSQCCSDKITIKNDILGL